LLISPAGGCTRKFFRKAADADVENLLCEKDRYDEWKIENWYVYPDPRARFADPTNPDRPPMPPDDPAARSLSPNPQKPRKAGVGLYEGTGYLDLLATWTEMNRQDPEVLPPPDPPPSATPVPDAEKIAQAQQAFLIKLEQACELGLLNSREYQD